MKRVVLGAVVVIATATGLTVWWSRSGAELEQPSPVSEPRVELPAAPAPVAPAPPERAAPLVVAPAPPPAPAAPVAVGPPGERERGEVLAKATREATERLEALRPELVQRCWATQPVPSESSSAGVDLEVTFDGNGREIARGGVEHRGSLPGVATCLKETDVGALRIAPTGQTLTVTVKLTVP